MISEYGTLVAPAIALLNGAIGAYATHYKLETARSKLVFMITLGVLSSFAIFASAAGTYSNSHHQQLLEARRDSIRKSISDSISQGRYQLDQLLTNSPENVDRAQIWTINTRAMLNTTLGKAYAVKFDDNVGIDTQRTTAIQKQAEAFYNVYFRIVRLEQFASEIPAGP